jgi:hypothetical protein
MTRWRSVFLLLLVLAFAVTASAATVRSIYAKRLSARQASWVAQLADTREEQHQRYRAGARIEELRLPDGSSLRFPGDPAVIYFGEPATLEGLHDVLIMSAFARHFGEALRVAWITSDELYVAGLSDSHPSLLSTDWIVDEDGAFTEQLRGRSLIVNGDGLVESGFTRPRERETRLYLNKLIPDRPFVSAHRELPDVADEELLDELSLYDPSGAPLTVDATTLVFLSAHCGGCDEWLAEGGLDDLDGTVTVVFTGVLAYEEGTQKYEPFIEARDSIRVALQLGVSPYRVRFPSVLAPAREG